MARTLMMAVVEANGSRQVVAAVASALLRTGGGDDDQGGSSKIAMRAMEKLDMHEQLNSVVEERLGPGVGIGAACKKLKYNGYRDVANSMSSIHRERKLVAHPVGCLASRLKNALQTIAENERANERGEELIVQEEKKACEELIVQEEKVQQVGGQLETTSGLVEEAKVQEEKVRQGGGQHETASERGEEVIVQEEKVRQAVRQQEELAQAEMLRMIKQMTIDMEQQCQVTSQNTEETSRCVASLVCDIEKKSGIDKKPEVG